MAKSATKPAIVKDTPETESGEKELTAAEKKILFEKYDAARKEADEAQADLEAANDRKSDIVKKIFEDIGVGPFKWKGKEMTVTNRNGRFYFRGEAKKQVTEIE